jgi:peptidoglycan biosynthesis protein MviN/MurJ (putative lipid II flippase)
LEPVVNQDGLPETANIARGSVRIYATVGAGAVIGLITTALLGFHFGTGDSIETFFVATTFYFVVTKLLQAGAIGGVATPILIRVRHANGVAAENSVLTGLLVVTLIISVVVAGLIAVSVSGLTTVMVPGFDDSKRDLVVPLARIMSLGIAAAPINALLTAYLNSKQKFGWPETTNLSGAMVNLAFVGLGASFIGIEAAAYGLVVSAWLSTTLLAIMAIGSGWRFRVSDIRVHAETIEWLKGLRPFTGYTVLMQIQAVVLVSVLSVLPDGSLAFYRYGSDLVAKAGGLLAGPINSMVLPYVAKARIDGGIDAFREALARASAASLALIIVPTVFIALNATGITESILGRGQFDGVAVRQVSIVIMISSLALPLQFVFSVFQKGLVGLQKNLLVNAVGVFGQIIIVGLTLFLVPIWAHTGAAWIGPISTAALLFVTGVMLWRLNVAPNLRTVALSLRAYSLTLVVILLAILGSYVGLGILGKSDITLVIGSGISIVVSAVLLVFVLKVGPLVVIWRSITNR